MASVLDIAGGGSFLNLFILWRVGVDAGGHSPSAGSETSSAKFLSSHHIFRAYFLTLHLTFGYPLASVCQHIVRLSGLQGVQSIPGNLEPLSAPSNIMDNPDFDFGIVYLIENAQQFWSGECQLHPFLFSH